MLAKDSAEHLCNPDQRLIALKTVPGADVEQSENPNQHLTLAFANPMAGVDPQAREAVGDAGIDNAMANLSIRADQAVDEYLRRISSNKSKTKHRFSATVVKHQIMENILNKSDSFQPLGSRKPPKLPTSLKLKQYSKTKVMLSNSCMKEKSSVTHNEEDMDRAPSSGAASKVCSRESFLKKIEAVDKKLAKGADEECDLRLALKKVKTALADEEEELLLRFKKSLRSRLRTLEPLLQYRSKVLNDEKNASTKTEEAKLEMDTETDESTFGFYESMNKKAALLEQPNTNLSQLSTTTQEEQEEELPVKDHKPELTLRRINLWAWPKSKTSMKLNQQREASNCNPLKCSNAFYKPTENDLRRDYEAAKYLIKRGNDKK